jgi:DNA-binding XRE family transcriptional regulator
MFYIDQAQGKEVRDDPGITANIRAGVVPSMAVSQERFAEFVGISVDCLSFIERGINAPSFETIELMARRLHVPVKALFEFPERHAGRQPQPLTALAMRTPTGCITSMCHQCFAQPRSEL